MKNVIVAVTALCMALLAGSFQHLSAGEKNNPRRLFEKKCSICHSIDRATSITKTKKGWKITVMRMKDEQDAEISNEEARIIINYLAENYGN